MIRCAFILSFVVALAAQPLRAQGGDVREESPMCFGFSFGPWTPPLDWRASGHAASPDSVHTPRAPEGRGWAMNGGASADSGFMLVPPWWPAGVLIQLENRRPAVGDTVAGRAIALVADDRAARPTSRVRAWAVPCGGARPPGDR